MPDDATTDRPDRRSHGGVRGREPVGAAVAQPDLTLLLDLDGVIRKATLANGFADETLTTWEGRPWRDTVADIAGEELQRIVADARRTGLAAFRQIVQRFPSGRELPIEYTTIRLGGQAGLMAVGRSLQAVSELQSRLLAAQHAREQDYWKLREIETRYRLLFDASHEAVLLLAADTLRVVEANPAALRELGLSHGWEFPAEVAANDLAPFRAMLQRVRDQGRAPGILVHLGPSRTPWMLRASLMAGDPDARFLLQIAPVVAPVPPPPSPDSSDPRPLDGVIARLPDGFVTFDASGRIRSANGAFLDLVQIAAEGAVIGDSLGRWVGMPGADLSVLLDNLRRHGMVRGFTTQLHGDLGSDIAVEITAAASTAGRTRLIGALVRDVGRHAAETPAAMPLATALAALDGEVGKTPLLQAVKAATGVLERHYIEAALGQAKGNRTAAAELLGLSRQSLYVKLDRYGMDGNAGVGGARDG
jgi:transcriptional regulator PpsR